MADLITLDEAKAYGKIRGSESDELLAAIVPAVSASIRQWTGFDWDLRAYTEPRNGSGLGQMTALRAGPPGPPILAPPAPPLTEDGLALPVAASDSTEGGGGAGRPRYGTGRLAGGIVDAPPEAIGEYSWLGRVGVLAIVPYGRILE